MASLTELNLGLQSGVGALLDRIYKWLLLFFIFLTLVLPSGSIYQVNVKLPLYAVLLPLALFSFFYNHQTTAPALLRLTGIPLLVAFWLMIAFLYNIPAAGALRQYTDIALTLLLCWLVQVFCNQDRVKLLLFMRLVIHAELAAGLLKIAVILYAVAHGIPVVEVMATVSSIFGVNLMSMDLGALLGRIQFVSDGVIPISLYAVLRHRDLLKLGSLRTSFTVLMLLLSVLISFSRYFWAFTAIALVLGLMLGKRDRFKAVLLGCLGVTLLASLPLLTILYDLRFSHEIAGYSDELRTEQAAVLKDFFFDAPLFGHGLGSYAPALVRETEAAASRYSYEMQLVALAGQVGLIGLFDFVLLLLWYYRGLWWKSSLPLRDRLSLSFLLLCWLVSGFYNPLLMNPVASIVYAMLAALTSVAAITPTGKLPISTKTATQASVRIERAQSWHLQVDPSSDRSP